MTEQTLDDALAPLGLDAAASPSKLVAALAAKIEPLTGDLRAAVEHNVAQDVAGKLEKLDAAGLDVPAEHKAKLEADARATWAQRVRDLHAEADAGLGAVEQLLTRRAEAERRLPSVAAVTPSADRVAFMLAQVLDGQEADRAERFTRERPGADVVRRYVSGTDDDDRGFARHLELEHAAGRLRLQGVDAPEALRLARTLGEAIAARREARVRPETRAALDALPKLRADLDRAAVVTRGDVRRGLRAVGKPGTGPTREARDAEAAAARDAAAAARAAEAQAQATRAAAGLRG